MKQTSNVERSTPNAELLSAPSEFDVKRQSGSDRSTFGVRRFPRLFGRTLELIIGALFIYAGVLKILDPVGFARDIDNYKILPWPAAVAFGFFLPWLEVFCGLALNTRQLYRGALWILSGLTIVFIVATLVAKARGLDISCGCFGHASKGWSFGWHLLLDFGILAALVILAIAQKRKVPAHESREDTPMPLRG